MGLITWTAPEMVIKGLGMKLKIDRTSFTEWNEAVATHCETMGMMDLFKYGPVSTSSPHPVHDQFSIEKIFFDSYGAMSTEQVKLRGKLIHTETGATNAIIIPKCEYSYLCNFIFTSLEDKLQKHAHQQI